MRALLVPAAGVLCAALLAGCGTNSSPCVYGTNFSVNPGSGTANHMDVPPGNQAKFFAYDSPYIISGRGCSVPEIPANVDATWTSSDPKDVSVSSAADLTNGLATCLGPTAGAVNLTASYSSPFQGSTPKSAAVTLTCK